VAYIVHKIGLDLQCSTLKRHASITALLVAFHNCSANAKIFEHQAWEQQSSKQHRGWAHKRR